MKQFIQELKRRNVIKSGLAYLVAAWGILQVMSIVLPTMEASNLVMKLIFSILLIGFPLWLVFSWMYQITAEGIKKTPSPVEANWKKGMGIHRILIGALAILVLIALLIVNMFSDKDDTLEVGSQMAHLAAPSDKSIAVLAFTDMSAGKDQEYFSDGISEEILNLLAKIPGFTVISRTSSFSFKGKKVDIQEIGSQLNVSHILEGSIRKSGNTFRITAQLINVNDGSHLWSETYDREMTDIFKIQDEIAGKVAQKLKITLLGGNSIKSQTVDPEAYNLYLKAKQLLQQQTSGYMADAENLIRQSIAIDSTYAPAWMYLSRIINYNTTIYGTISLREGTEMAMKTITRAIALDSTYAPAYAQFALIQTDVFNFEGAATNFKRALQLAPENSEVLKMAAINKMNFGKLDEVIGLSLKALELDPLNYSIHWTLTLAYLLEKDFDNAQIQMEIYLTHYPNAFIAYHLYAEILLGTGDAAQAALMAEKESNPFWKLYAKCMTTYASGNKVASDKLLKEFVKKYGNDSWPNIAHIYAFRKENDLAFLWLDRALEHQDSSVLQILNYVGMENLWGDPRWNIFINKLGLPKDHGFHLDK